MLMSLYWIILAVVVDGSPTTKPPPLATNPVKATARVADAAAAAPGGALIET